MTVDVDALPADLPGGDEATAAEYVLGLLSDAEATRFEAQLNKDQDLQQDVAAWQAYFCTFLETVQPQTPPPALWREVEKRVGQEPRPPFWRQVLPYLIGAAIGAALSWAVSAFQPGPF
ncbi:hypothetical protein J7443_23020 [Tropicibacter sp. R15_0]|uniref:hypothetical protein n=1 Tax=Tropicibacter sp. R15_0 TaxID=2821101 RepID=UPI001ADC3E37|nr:hypothetical protein [Tropicibacter sp. R15_0]MBO9468116.1 hypothetical protein [Tropicibacter sp. R15_0]